MIPKIIHQTGPSDKSNWHPLWFECQQSWLKNFPDYEYKFWNDEEIDELVKNDYPEYWDMYQELPVHIMKIDFVRFCFMDKFGGIYADLDFYCYKNFQEVLINDTYVVENPFGNDPIENSLMCSVPGSLFFKKCLQMTKQRFEEIKIRDSQKLSLVKDITDRYFDNKGRPYLVFYISGTNLISSVYRKNQNIVSTLSGYHFNNLDYSYEDSFFTKHVHTGTWGKENIEKMDKDQYFSILRNIPTDSYNFYYDYSKGRYKEQYKMDFSKNDVENDPQVGDNFYYA